MGAPPPMTIAGRLARDRAQYCQEITREGVPSLHHWREDQRGCTGKFTIHKGGVRPLTSGVGSHMVPKHEFLRMRIEIDLVSNVAHVEYPNVVPDRRQWNDQGNKPSMIVVNHARQLSFLVTLQLILEVARNMLQHIHMLADRRFHLLQGQLFRTVPLGPGPTNRPSAWQCCSL